MNITNILESGEFDKLIDISTDDKVWNDLVSEIYNFGVYEENILGYYACVKLLDSNLSKFKRAELHYTAAIILTMGINFVCGGYMLGFYHMKKAIELDFNNIDYKVYMLSTFANSPEIVIPKEYVNHIVSEILTKNPNNEVALRFLT